MKNICLVFSLSFLILSCNGQSRNSRQNIKYNKGKSEFRAELIRHFPKDIENLPSEIVNAKDISSNNVSFMLYEYNANAKEIDSVSSSIQQESIAKYNSKDLCLLIINRFVTPKSYNDMADTEIKDSTEINRDCYKNLYPIPNFINYNSPNENSDLRLTGNFDIYVIEAKSGNYFKEFNLLPNPQMPPKWKNGYSRGIAISKDKNTLIYWASVW